MSICQNAHNNYNVLTLYIVRVNTDNEYVKKNSSTKTARLCLVNHTNVLWTCHKACKIEFDDCAFALCSVCYANKADENDKSENRVSKKSRKRRGDKKSLDDNLELCNHSVDALVPFMDQTFFSAKYKETIRNEKYTLPLKCSGCDGELMDKIRNDGESSTDIIDV